jgi:NAD(P)-dependent dehydrogenase (short-subunit alcohol dehydrogenase family)
MTSSELVAVVTGAAQGIGRGIAAQLAADGYAVLIADLRLDAAKSAAGELEKSGAQAGACQVDVADPDACGRMVAAAVERFGRLDVLVNNAGISKPGPTLDVAPVDWQRMIDVQLNGTFYCSQAAGRQMVAQGTSGCIVNITSIGAEAAYPQRASYNCAKAGVHMLTKVLAIEWAQYGIRVNAVGPAHTETEMTRNLVAQGLYKLDDVKRRIPLGRLAQVQDVANAVSFLVSERASFITGHALYVDGGYLAYGYW